MATARRWTPRVDQAALDVPRPLQADTSGIRALAHGIDQVASAQEAADNKALADARRVRVTDAQARLARQRQSIEDTVRQAKGRDALSQDLEVESQKLLDMAADQIEAEFADDAHLVEAFKLHREDQRGQLANVARDHVVKQSDALAIQAHKDTLELADADARRAAADGDMGGVERAAEIKRGAIASEARRLGLDPRTAEVETAKELTAMHVGVVNALLAGETPNRQAAKDYLTTGPGRGLPSDVKKELEAKMRPGLVKDAARLEADRILASGKTYEQQLEAAAALPDTDLADAVTARVKLRHADQKNAREEDEKQAVARIFGRIIDARGNYSLRTDEDYEGLSDVGKTLVKEKLDAEQRQERAASKEKTASAAEARRQQRDIDEEAWWRFQALSLRDKAESDVARLFPGVSRPELAKLGADQAKAKRLLEKGVEVGFNEFKTRVELANRDPDFGVAMERWFFDWQDQPGNEGKLPGDKEVTSAMAERLVLLDIPWGRDKPAFKVPNPKQYKPRPVEEQPFDLAKPAVGTWNAPPKAPAAPAPAAPVPAPAQAARPGAAPAEGTEVPGEAIGLVGGKYRRVKGGWRRVE